MDPKRIAWLPLQPGFWLNERGHWAIGFFWLFGIGPLLFIAGFAAILLVVCATGPGVLLHRILWRRSSAHGLPTALRVLFYATLIAAYAVSATLMTVYVLPELQSKYDYLNEPAPCVQGSGWGC